MCCVFPQGRLAKASKTIQRKRLELADMDNLSSGHYIFVDWHFEQSVQRWPSMACPQSTSSKSPSCFRKGRGRPLEECGNRSQRESAQNPAVRK